MKYITISLLFLCAFSSINYASENAKELYDQPTEYKKKETKQTIQEKETDEVKQIIDAANAQIQEQKELLTSLETEKTKHIQKREETNQFLTEAAIFNEEMKKIIDNFDEHVKKTEEMQAKKQNEWSSLKESLSSLRSSIQVLNIIVAAGVIFCLYHIIKTHYLGHVE